MWKVFTNMLPINATSLFKCLVVSLHNKKKKGKKKKNLGTQEISIQTLNLIAKLKWTHEFVYGPLAWQNYMIEH